MKITEYRLQTIEKNALKLFTVYGLLLPGRSEIG